MPRVLRFFLWTMIVVVALGGALVSYFVYTPRPEVPRLSGRLSSGVIEIGGLKRSFLNYVPRRLPKGAPLVVVMHGSDENAPRMRIATGYAFEATGSAATAGAAQDQRRLTRKWGDMASTRVCV